MATWLFGFTIVVTGSAGRGEVSVPVLATAPPAIPLWLGWLIGFIPLAGLLAFLSTQRSRRAKPLGVALL